ncbi:MAG TPA: hypothetical protein VHF01_13075 [Candidatus Acidoferrum sp.]|nr:hypothetical protein [Candidatus Acidoferrum sp.]
MKKLAALTLSLFLISGTALADTPKEADPQPAKPGQPAKPKAANKAEKTDSAFAAELEELRQTLQAQQEQLQMLKEELAKRDRQIDEARESAAAASARAAEASRKAIEAVNTTAEVKSTAESLNATVTSLKASNEALKTTVAAEQAEAKKASEDGPASIKVKGVTITPGGFFAAETVFRNRAVVADDNTPFNSIPYPGSSQSRLSEFNASGRQTRPTVLVEGKAENVKFTGYYEADFLSAGTTSNNNGSNSYTFRQRQAWGQAALNSGWTVTGGQMWSLVTETKTGMQNRIEAVPLTIDHQYNVGFSWARQYGFRVVKNFGDKFALGFSAEGSQTTFGGRGFSTFTDAKNNANGNFLIAAPGSGGGLFNATANYTFNKTPDFVFKAVFQPGWGHYEIFGLVSTYRSRIFPCGVVSAALPCAVNGSTAPSAVGVFNDSRSSGGIGVNVRVPLVAKKLDAGVHFLGGDGIGRYGTAGLPDATARPDGSLALIKGVHALGTLEWHPTPKLDIYANFGGEYAYRAAYLGYTTITQTTNAAGVITTTTKTNQAGGYGSPFSNNSGCGTEVVAPNQNTPASVGKCAGDTKNIFEGSLGFWYRFYQGPFGRLQFGTQYSYITKVGWSGNNNVPAAVGISPKAVDNMVLTSFRYYIP